MRCKLLNTAILCFGMAVLSCCEKESIINNKEVTDANGVVVKKNYLWKIPTSNSRTQSVGGIIAPIILNNKIITNYFYDSNPTNQKCDLELLDLDSQEPIWKWRDFIYPEQQTPTSMGYLGIGHYVYNNTYIFHSGPITYCVDLNNGKTRWKVKNEFFWSFPQLYENGSEYYVAGNSIVNQQKKILATGIFRGDAETGETTEIVTPKYSRNYERDMGDGISLWGDMAEIMPIEENGEKLLFIAFVESRNVNQSDGYIGLYNMTTKKWVYERKQLFPEVIVDISSGHIMRRDNKIYLVAGNLVACVDWRTGERLWNKHDMPSFANILGLFDDKYLMLYDSMRGVYCVDADTGQEYWKQTGEVLSYTAFYYDQGIYYYAADGKLKARDFKTRKLLWEITSDTDGKTDGHFAFFVTGVPGKNGKKGKIYARTGFDMYCYEAIK